MGRCRGLRTFLRQPLAEENSLKKTGKKPEIDMIVERGLGCECCKRLGICKRNITVSASFRDGEQRLPRDVSYTEDLCELYREQT
eukprot:6200726-Pleurochrysis_carterae.AAC.1